MFIIVIDYTILVADPDKTKMILDTLARQSDNAHLFITHQKNKSAKLPDSIEKEYNITYIEYSEDTPKNQALYERLLNFNPNTPSTNAENAGQKIEVGQEKTKAHNTESEAHAIEGVLIYDPDVTSEYVEKSEYFKFDDTYAKLIRCWKDENEDKKDDALYSPIRTLNVVIMNGRIANITYDQLELCCDYCHNPPDQISQFNGKAKTWFLGISATQQISRNELILILEDHNQIINKERSRDEARRSKQPLEAHDKQKEEEATIKTPFLNTDEPKTKYYAKHDSTLFQKIDTKKVVRRSHRMNDGIGTSKYTPFI